MDRKGLFKESLLDVETNGIYRNRPDQRSRNLGYGDDRPGKPVILVFKKIIRTNCHASYRSKCQYDRHPWTTQNQTKSKEEPGKNDSSQFNFGTEAIKPVASQEIKK